MAFEQYTTFTTSALVQTVLPAIAAYFNDSRKVPCTVDELIAALRVPTSVQTQVASTTTAAAAKPKAAKVANGKGGCQYVLTRGENKGNNCPASVKPGEIYCTTCKKKKNVGGAGAKAKAVGSVPGAPSFGTPQAPPPNASVNAEAWTGKDPEFTDLLFIPLYQILVRQTPTIVCYGRVVDGKRAPLDEATSKVVAGLGITVADSAKYQPPQASVTNTSLPQATPIIPGIIAGVAVNTATTSTPPGGASTTAMPGLAPMMQAPAPILAQANGGVAPNIPNLDGLIAPKSG